MEDIKELSSIVDGNFVMKGNKLVGITAVQLLLQGRAGRYELREAYLYPVHL